MDYQVDPAVEILRRTPGTLNGLLAGLPDEWTHSAAGDGAWSATDVVSHLLHGERSYWNWIARTRTILDYGESRALDWFDQSAVYDDDEGYSLEQLLAAFAQARAQNLATLEGLSLTSENLARKGIHEVLGTVTLSEVLAAWVVHDMNHVGQIVEGIAHQYAEAVGPWRLFLPIVMRPTNGFPVRYT